MIFLVEKSLKYQRSTTSGCNDIGIRKSEFVTRTQFLCLIEITLTKDNNNSKLTLTIDPSSALVPGEGTSNLFPNSSDILEDIVLIAFLSFVVIWEADRERGFVFGFPERTSATRPGLGPSPASSLASCAFSFTLLRPISRGPWFIIWPPPNISPLYKIFRKILYNCFLMKILEYLE